MLLLWGTLAFIGVFQQALFTAAEDCIVTKRAEKQQSWPNFSQQEVAAVKNPGAAGPDYSEPTCSSLCTAAFPFLLGLELFKWQQSIWSGQRIVHIRKPVFNTFGSCRQTVHFDHILEQNQLGLGIVWISTILIPIAILPFDSGSYRFRFFEWWSWNGVTWLFYRAFST